MGNSPKAILAYGYDLGNIASHFEWHYDGDVQSGGPEWHDSDCFTMAGDAGLALLKASGVSLDQYDEMTMAEQDEAKRAVGVRLVRHGSDEGDEELLLVVKVVETDWDGPLPVADDLGSVPLPDGADERLEWALEVLGIDIPTTTRPQWLLAAYYG